MVFVWGAIGLGYKKLVFLPARAVTSSVYRTRCLRPVLKDLRSRRGAIFMHNGTSAHCANAALFATGGVRLLTSPARSSDLSPIEALWNIIGRQVDARRPSGVAELRRCWQEEWDTICQDTVDSLVLSFNARLEACIRERGNSVDIAL